MKIAYTGRLEKLDPVSQKKLDARVARLDKMLDGRAERDARVVLTRQRHLHHAEVAVNYYDHPLVGEGAATEKLSALLLAFDKLEKQLVKHRTKWHDSKRSGSGTIRKPAPAPVPPAEEESPAPRINRVRLNRKPMNAEEALLELNSKKAYIAFHDSESGGISVLIRRPDGHFDLVES